MVNEGQIEAKDGRGERRASAQGDQKKCHFYRKEAREPETTSAPVSCSLWFQFSHVLLQLELSCFSLIKLQFLLNGLSKSILKLL